MTAKKEKMKKKGRWIDNMDLDTILKHMEDKYQSFLLDVEKIKKLKNKGKEFALADPKKAAKMIDNLYCLGQYVRCLRDETIFENDVEAIKHAEKIERDMKDFVEWLNEDDPDEKGNEYTPY